MLVGRRIECDVLDELLEEVRGGHSCVLVVRGEPGVGKTALADYAMESASGFRIAHAAGVESEAELAFAALQQLCTPMLDRIEDLPRPQRDALGAALGLSAGGALEPYLVGLAALSLLSGAAQERPLLCIVDDAHWLDRASAQALAFVARRLLADRVAFLFATRAASDDLTGLPELRVDGLAAEDARTLLASAIDAPRQGRNEAATQLRLAHEMLQSMGGTAFANRARVELLAIGEQAGAAVSDTHDGLTPREQQIALLAVEGESDAEIAAELFLSPHTVDYHLRNVFDKLGIDSRDRLAGALGDGLAAAAPGG